MSTLRHFNELLARSRSLHAAHVVECLFFIQFFELFLLSALMLHHQSRIASDDYGYFFTYVFKAVLAQLRHDVEKTERRKPRNPEHDFMKILKEKLHVNCDDRKTRKHETHLDVDDPEDEDEFVENEVPKLVLHVLRGEKK